MARQEVENGRQRGSGGVGSGNDEDVSLCDEPFLGHILGRGLLREQVGEEIGPSDISLGGYALANLFFGVLEEEVDFPLEVQWDGEENEGPAEREFPSDLKECDYEGCVVDGVDPEMRLS